MATFIHLSASLSTISVPELSPKWGIIVVPSFLYPPTNLSCFKEAPLLCFMVCVGWGEEKDFEFCLGKVKSKCTSYIELWSKIQEQPAFREKKSLNISQWIGAFIYVLSNIKLTLCAPNDLQASVETKLCCKTCLGCFLLVLSFTSSWSFSKVNQACLEWDWSRSSCSPMDDGAYSWVGGWGYANAIICVDTIVQVLSTFKNNN